MTSMFTHLDRAMRREQTNASHSLPPFTLIPGQVWMIADPEDALGPIAHAPVTPATPMWLATCEAVPEARGCRTCGALGDAPCVTCSGRECGDHKGRGVAA